MFTWLSEEHVFDLSMIAVIMFFLIVIAHIWAMTPKKRM